MRSDPEAGRRAAEEAIALLRSQPDADLEVRARLLLCDYWSERDTRAARAQLDSITVLLPHIRRKGLAAGSFDCRGQMEEADGDHVRAREYYDQAVAIAEREHDSEMLAAGLFSRGYLMGLQGHYASGLTDLRRAQTLFESVNLPMHSLTTLNAIAILYNRMGDYEQSRHIYERALKAQRAAGLRREQAVTLYNLGRVHENLKDWNAAEQHFNESVRVARELNYARAEAYSLQGLAYVANARGEPLTALAKLESAAELQRTMPDARLRAQIQLVRGESLRLLGRYEEAIGELQAALKFFGDTESLSELRNTHEVLAKSLSDSGDWRSAYTQLDEAKRIAELLFHNQIDERFSSLKVEFDTLAKEQENAVLMRENEASQKALALERQARRLNAIVILLIVLLAIVLGALAVYQSRIGRRMRRLAMTDELTGLPNRRSVLTRFEPLLQPSSIRACAMLIIDIDHFKSINDKYGHAEGDAALKLVAGVLKTLREPAFSGRLGGEEFVAVMPGADIEMACAIAETLRQQVMSLDSLPWLNERPMTVSIGVAVARADKDSASAMLHRADVALYEAKRAGRNCVITEDLVAAQSKARASDGTDGDESRPPLTASSVEFA